MRPVIIGAGRGSRLGPETNTIPKTLVPVMGRPMLDWILDAITSAGFSKKDVLFICGYQADVVRARHPEFTFVENTDWQNNNILLSLLTAREHLKNGFISTYADIVYRGEIVRELKAAPGDMVLGCDTEWRRRYHKRTQHPESDAEKLRADGSRVVELSRKIESEKADGEFIGVAKFSPAGVKTFLEAFDQVKAEYAGKVFREGRTFEKAYLIDLFQWMLERGAHFERANTPGGYMEIDTLQDLAFAAEWWAEADELEKRKKGNS